MEITWFGETCVRLKGREGVVAADAFRSIAGPTGRGMTADIVTYSHADEAEPAKAGTRAAKSGAAASDGLGVVRPTSLESAFPLDAPGEYEVHEVLVTGALETPPPVAAKGESAPRTPRVVVPPSRDEGVGGPFA